MRHETKVVYSRIVPKMDGNSRITDTMIESGCCDVKKALLLLAQKGDFETVDRMTIEVKLQQRTRRRSP